MVLLLDLALQDALLKLGELTSVTIVLHEELVKVFELAAAGRSAEESLDLTNIKWKPECALTIHLDAFLDLADLLLLSLLPEVL